MGEGVVVLRLVGMEEEADRQVGEEEGEHLNLEEGEVVEERKHREGAVAEEGEELITQVQEVEVVGVELLIREPGVGLVG